MTWRESTEFSDSSSLVLELESNQILKIKKRFQYTIATKCLLRKMLLQYSNKSLKCCWAKMLIHIDRGKIFFQGRCEGTLSFGHGIGISFFSSWLDFVFVATVWGGLRVHSYSGWDRPCDLSKDIDEFLLGRGRVGSMSGQNKWMSEQLIGEFIINKALYKRTIFSII